MDNLYHLIQLQNLTVPNIMLAPLAGYTSLPTRLVYRQQGEFLCYTEMVSAEGLNYSFAKSAEILQTTPQDRPLGIQIFGSDHKKIQQAFFSIKDFSFDTIDLNCGCSIKKVIKSKSGAFLLNDPDEIARIILSIKNETDKPVTLKIRSGYHPDSINFLEVLDAGVRSGASMITLHPRTKTQLFTGSADWSLIKRMKQKSSIPVIGNGDIFSASDAVRMMQTTGCDGIMVARGIIENPFILEEIKAAFNGDPYTPPVLEDRMNRLLSHARGLITYLGDEHGLREFRKFLKGYLKSIPESAKLRYQLNFVDNYREFEYLIKTFFETANNYT